MRRIGELGLRKRQDVGLPQGERQRAERRIGIAGTSLRGASDEGDAA